MKTTVFTLAASQDTGILWPKASLEENIRHYHSRVEPGEEEPAGEDPITGALAHLEEIALPECFAKLLAAVEAANCSHEIAVAFSEDLSPENLTLELWQMPRKNHDHMDGYLGTFHVGRAITPAGVEEAVRYISEARCRYRPNHEAAHI